MSTELKWSSTAVLFRLLFSVLVIAWCCFTSFQRDWLYGKRWSPNWMLIARYNTRSVPEVYHTNIVTIAGSRTVTPCVVWTYCGEMHHRFYFISLNELFERLMLAVVCSISTNRISFFQKNFRYSGPTQYSLTCTLFVCKLPIANLLT